MLILSSSSIFGRTCVITLVVAGDYRRPGLNARRRGGAVLGMSRCKEARKHGHMNQQYVDSCLKDN